MLVQIVDDSSVNCEIFAALIERLDSEVGTRAFLDPHKAFAACQDRLPDLIVVDFMMPGLNGNEYVEKVRSLPGAKNVPIVMITTAIDKAIRHKALELGVTDFLTKPIDRQEMRARLTNLMALRRAHIALQDRSRWLAEEVRKATEQVLHQANHDALTGLPNRAFFRATLDQVLSRAALDDGCVAVLYLDLDGFKAVNDTAGHAVGDDLLQQVGATLQALLGPGETAARLGGDEFAMIQVGVAQPAGAARLAAGIIEAIAQLNGAAAIPSDVGVSVGVALWPADARGPSELMQRADIALYRAKHDGKGRSCFFEPDMDAELREKRALERDLRVALSSGEFDVQYLPQAVAATGEIVGFEAQLRWRHPERGVVSSADFLSVAEECGLIRSLGEWLLRQACVQAVTWPSAIRLGVNLSPVQVRADLPLLVERILGDTGLAPERLELEITEGVLMTATASTATILSALKDLGVSIALDDFGTGLSSLGSLAKLPFDRIKIDRSFTAELLRMPEAAAIIGAILGMTRSLSIASIAEGVETVQQLDVLQRERCQQVQGVLIGPAMQARDVSAFLTSRPDKLAAA